MKLSMLLCGAALLAAGCSSPENPYATTGEYSYTYDYVPAPVAGIPPPELDKIYQAQVTGSTLVSSGSGGSEYSGR